MLGCKLFLPYERPFSLLIVADFEKFFYRYNKAGENLLMSSMAWVRRCYSEKSKNLNKLLVFEALYPPPGENADLANLN